MSDSGTSAALKRLSRQPLDSATLHAFVMQTVNDSDRTVGISLGTFLEDSLSFALKQIMRPLNNSDEARIFGPEAPLGSFSAKIRFAYVLKIVDADHRDDMDRVREIRNAFAHTLLPINFNTKEVSDVCALFKCEPAKQSPVFNAKGVYVSTCLLFSGALRYGKDAGVIWRDEKPSPQKSS